MIDGVPKILPPTDDMVFKTLLTHPNTREALKDIIASFTGLKVQSVDVLNNELPVSSILEKAERLDVNCVTDGGEQVNVEMQAAALKGDSAANEHKGLKSRFIYNLCNLHASQEGMSIDYKNMVRTYQMTFCGFEVFKGRKNPFNWFRLRNDDGETLLDDINIGFIELTKLGEILKKSPAEMTGADSWSVYIRYVDNPKYKGLIAEVVSGRREIAMVNEVLLNISQDDHERARYLSRKKYLMDEAHNLIVSRKEGIAIGKLDDAKAMLSDGLPLEKVIQYTGLSSADLEKLKNR
jgi:predicted transposase/invertase (TIGR01784 family)